MAKIMEVDEYYRIGVWDDWLNGDSAGQIARYRWDHAAGSLRYYVGPTTRLRSCDPLV